MNTTISKSKNNFDAIIIGGGLAGLTSAIMLARNAKKVLLIEKKSYPHHRVCGEYISNEVLPFLRSFGFDPFKYGAMPINKLRISTPAGKNISLPLDMGGFGLSRYVMDYSLSQIAQQCGAYLLTKTKVTDIAFDNATFTVKTNNNDTFSAGIVIGSFGKRDTLDKQLSRTFTLSHTGYLGVKYHIKTDYPIDEIGLDNFEGGYCGISRVEEGKYNLCYLFHRKKQAQFKTIPDIEENILFRNPVLSNIFHNSEFLFPKPEVINDFSFSPKSLVENHILMCGDSAGLITPLCGNGMSMAIHSAKLLCDLIIQSGVLDTNVITTLQREHLERVYKVEWQKNFSKRLFWGRTIQKIFGNSKVTGIGVKSIHAIPPLERWLIAKTHGDFIPV
jgi:flavin-dependent dehydrogenase